MRAAAKAGTAASRLATRTAIGTARSTGARGTTGSGRTPRVPANVRQATRPVATPTGSPSIRAKAMVVVACHTTVVVTWWRSKPRVLRMARSRRRRRTEVTRVWPSMAEATTAMSPAMIAGRLCTRPKFTRSTGRSWGRLLTERSPRRRRAAVGCTPGAHFTKKRLRAAGCPKSWVRPS